MYLIRTKSSDYLYYSRSSHWFWSIIYLYIKQLCNRYKGRACAVVKVIDLEAFQCDFADLRRETQLMSLFQYSTLLRVRGGCWINGSKLHTLQLVSWAPAVLSRRKHRCHKRLNKRSKDWITFHINGWLHCDIKASNMLVDEDGTVLVGDFWCRRLSRWTNFGEPRVGSLGQGSVEARKTSSELWGVTVAL